MTIHGPSLRHYQRDGGEATEAAFFDDGMNRVLVKLPTGTGKTVMFAAFREQFERLRAWQMAFPKNKRQMLVIAHREELLDQAAEKIQKANPDLIVCIEQGSRRSSRYADVVVASIQTLAAENYRRLYKLLATMTFRIVVVDEAHHSAAFTYRTVLAILGFLPKTNVEGDGESLPPDARGNIEAAGFDDVKIMEVALLGWDAIAPKDRLLVGVTATPNRTDAIGLGCVYQTIAFDYALRQAIEDGWLSEIRPIVVETSTSLDNVKMSRGDFNQKYLAEAVNTSQRNRIALAAWKEYAYGRPTICFTVDVAHAHEMARLFADDGIKAVAISGETPKSDRRVFQRQFQNGQLDALMNCMVLTEGTDLPRTSCILHTKPTQSPTLYEQMTGRGLRVDPRDPAGPDRLAAIARGDALVKPDCLVIDVVDIARKHSLQTSGVLYGLPPSLNGKGKTLKEMAERYEAFIEKNPKFTISDTGRFTLEDLEARVSTFDIWTVQPTTELGEGRACHWLKTGDGEYRLQYPWSSGQETLAVTKDVLGHFDVSLTLRGKDAEDNPIVRQRTIASQVDTPIKAVDLAEQFVLSERRSVMKLMGANEPWRQKRATPAQVGLLRRFNIPFDDKHLTTGAASQLLDMAMSKKGEKIRNGDTVFYWRGMKGAKPIAQRGVVTRLDEAGGTARIEYVEDNAVVKKDIDLKRLKPVAELHRT